MLRFFSIRPAEFFGEKKQTPARAANEICPPLFAESPSSSSRATLYRLVHRHTHVHTNTHLATIKGRTHRLCAISRKASRPRRRVFSPLPPSSLFRAHSLLRSSLTSRTKDHETHTTHTGVLSPIRQQYIYIYVIYVSWRKVGAYIYLYDAL